MIKVLAVTGYKNFELGIFKNDAKEATYIKRALQKQIKGLLDEGLEWVIITGQLGVELWAGEAVIDLKKEYKGRECLNYHINQCSCPCMKYISKEDIHVYSIDEAFMDVTDYLTLYNMSARTLGKTILNEIYVNLGIRAACGIGSNLYLTKVALDITAKHAEDFIGELTQESYRELLWSHRPLTDFWRIGNGIARKLENAGIFTMKDIAHADEDFLYHLFGVDAELLIDHAWGREPVTIADIKSYRARTNCLSSGQVLPCAYGFHEGRLIVKEMADLLCLDLVEKGLVTKSVTLHIGYDNRLGAPPAHGSTSLDDETSADLLIVPAVEKLYERIVNPALGIKRVTLTFNNVILEEFHQYHFFMDTESLEKNRRIQKAVLSIKQKYGKNAVLKGMNLEEHATTKERNMQIGGHRSGIET